MEFLENLRVDVERALRASYPDRADKIIRALEENSAWHAAPDPEKYRLALEIAMGLPRGRNLTSVVSTIFGPWNAAGPLTEGTDLSIGRDLRNTPPSIMTSPYRLSHGRTFALCRLHLVVEGLTDLAGWYLRVQINDRRFLANVDAQSMTFGVVLPLPVIVHYHDDLWIRMTYHRHGEGGPAQTAPARYRFGLCVSGVEARSADQ